MIMENKSHSVTLRTCCGHAPSYTQSPLHDHMLWVLTCPTCHVSTDEYPFMSEANNAWNRGHVQPPYDPNTTSLLDIKKQAIQDFMLISGGQAGVGVSSLVGAQRVGVKTGGFAPKGWLTERGPQPILGQYGLIEAASPGYAFRTEANVKMADITLILSVKLSSAGTVKTIKLAKKHRKPYICIDPYDPKAIPLALAFLLKHRPKIVNVAGNRESICPGISKQVAYVIEQVIIQYNVKVLHPARKAKSESISCCT